MRAGSPGKTRAAGCSSSTPRTTESPTPARDVLDHRRVLRQLSLRAGRYALGSQSRLTLRLPCCQGTDKIRWKVVRLRYHEAIELDQAVDSSPKRLSAPRRTLGFLRVAP